MQTYPELSFRSLLDKPIPEYAAARFRGGAAAMLKKDCECTHHTGPHFLMADRAWKSANRQRLGVSLGVSIGRTSDYLAVVGYGTEEKARLAQLHGSLAAKGIETLFTVDDALALMAGGEPVFG